jgi:hypothetical protein
MKIFHAYHKEDQGLFGGKSFNTSKAIEVGDTLFVVLGMKRNTNGPTDYFLDGKFDVLSVDANPPESRWKWKLHLEPLVRSEEPINFSGGSGFDEKSYRDYFISTGGFKEIKPEKNALVELFDQLLEDAGSSIVEVSGDIEALYLDKTLGETTRKQLVEARIGQGLFRKNVIGVWGRGEQCVVTGVSVRDVLVASHIKPWKVATTEERLAGWNGLLLAAHLDRLFDRYLISFDGSGKIVISQRLTTQHRDELKTTGLNGNMKLDFSQIGMVSKAKIEKMLREHHAELMRLDPNAG